MTSLACRNLSCGREHWLNSGPSQFQDVTLDFAEGEVCGVAGPEGCGKGLLLNVLGLLEAPDAGEIFVDNQVVTGLTDAQTRLLRNEAFGFLFNHSYLLPSFSVAENVATPLFRICGGEANDALERMLDALNFCGIAHQEGMLTARLSPAERQVVAFARALVHGPKILVAVSPSDGAQLLPLARRVAEERGLCVLWAGDDTVLTGSAHRILQLEGGKIINDRRL